MKFISIIPARAGSKGIKNKNIVKLNRKSLIEYTFSAADKSKVKKNFVLTDSKKIKLIAKKYKINSEYIRPRHLSKDKTSLIDTLAHFYTWLDSKKIKFDYLIILQPTSPLRTYKDINRCIKIIEEKKPLSLFSISPSIEHPYEAIKKISRKKWDYVIERKKKVHRRQDFKLESYFENGAIYICHLKLIIEKKIFSKINHENYIMSKINSFDINDKEDLKICELIIKKNDKIKFNKVL